MTDERQVQESTKYGDEIDLWELLRTIWAGKWLIGGITFAAAVISVIVALMLPNIYRAEVLLAPNHQDGAGGLSALAEDDIVMRAGDVLMVPVRSQEVTVIGEVQYATSHFYDQALARDDYVNLSGGTTANADNKRIYVVRANGAVVAGKSSRWFKGKSVKIFPGDTVVVPMDTDRTPKLAQWTSITQVIYQMAIAVAAVNSF